MTKPFTVVFKTSLGDIKRFYSFPTFQNSLKNGESMTISEVWSNESLSEVYIKDQQGTLHYGIEVTEN